MAPASAITLCHEEWQGSDEIGSPARQNCKNAVTKQYHHAAFYKLMNLFIFRRDLRITDNTALTWATNSGETLPVFILDPVQQEQNPYFSPRARDFMMDSLDALRLYMQGQGKDILVLRGDPVVNVLEVIRKYPVEDIFFNRDYTPFSKRRDSAIAVAASKFGVGIKAYDDYMLSDPEIKSQGGNYFTNFTAFYRRVLKTEVRNPVTDVRWNNLCKFSDGEAVSREPQPRGREAGLMMLDSYVRESMENEPTKEGIIGASKNTRLSAHLKFGTLSVREVYNAFKRIQGGESS